MRNQNPSATMDGAVAGARADEARPATVGSLEPFARLVKLLARAFYHDLGFNGSELTAQCDQNRGVAVAILDHLTRHQWVREDRLAKSLKINKTLLPRILHLLEEERLLKRKTVKSAVARNRGHTAAAAGDLDDQTVRATGEGTLSYCCVNYPEIWTVASYKLLKMEEKLKTQLDPGNATPQYLCYNCNRSYEVFDAMQLQKHEDGSFHCEKCNRELVAEIEGEKWAGGRNGRKIRTAKYVDKLETMKEQMKALRKQLDLIKHLPAPDFGYLQEGEVTNAVQFTLRPLLGETRDEACLPTFDEKDENGFDCSKTMPKSLIRKGMVRPQEYDTDEDNKIFLFQNTLRRTHEARKTKEPDVEALERDSGLPLVCEERVVRKVGSKSKRRDDGVMCEEEHLADLQKDNYDEQRLQPPEVPSSAVKPTQYCSL